jgi:hypothetical protein
MYIEHNEEMTPGTLVDKDRHELKGPTRNYVLAQSLECGSSLTVFGIKIRQDFCDLTWCSRLDANGYSPHPSSLNVQPSLLAYRIIFQDKGCTDVYLHML